MKLEDLAEKIVNRLQPPDKVNLDHKDRAGMVTLCLLFLQTIADLCEDEKDFDLLLHHSVLLAGVKRKELANARTAASENRGDQVTSDEEGKKPPGSSG